MKRLTKKYHNNYCSEDNQNSLLPFYEKLGKLEDIEEELKCPLDFVATPYRYIGLRKIWYRKQYCEVVRIVVYEEMTRPYMEVRVNGLKRLKIVFLDNYKDTWALTKEELEK